MMFYFLSPLIVFGMFSYFLRKHFQTFSKVKFYREHLHVHFVPQ